MTVGLGVSSAHDWHCGGRFRVCRVLCTPELCHRLQLCVEVDASLAVEVVVTQERASGTSERKHGQWYGNGDIHADLKCTKQLTLCSSALVV